MRTAYNIYVALCLGIGAVMQAGTAHPDYFLGAFYGLMGSLIGPGLLATGLAQLAGWGKLGVPAMLGISLAFWLLFFSIAKRPRRAKVAKATAIQPVQGWEVSAPVVIDYMRRTSKHTTWEEE